MNAARDRGADGRGKQANRGGSCRCLAPAFRRRATDRFNGTTRCESASETWFKSPAWYEWPQEILPTPTQHRVRNRAASAARTASTRDLFNSEHPQGPHVSRLRSDGASRPQRISPCGRKGHMPMNNEPNVHIGHRALAVKASGSLTRAACAPPMRISSSAPNSPRRFASGRRAYLNRRRSSGWNAATCFS